MKKFLVLLFTAALSVSSFMTAFAVNSISIVLNGHQIEFDTNPEIVNDITFVPLRAIAEALNSTVNWIDESKTINITKGDVTTILAIGSAEVKTQTANKTEANTIEAAPYIKDERTMVPLRFISESFGMNVTWNGETQTVTISEKKSENQSPDSVPEKIDKDKILYYSDFKTVPDFGACFGYEDDNRVSAHFYNETKAEDRKAYTNLIKSVGFKQVDEMVTSEVESYGYEKDDIQVVTALYNIEGMKGIYGISIQKKPEKFTDEIKYYKDYKGVPDFGILEAVKLTNTSKIAPNMTEYTYKLSDENGMEKVLMQYTDILNKCGFSSLVQNLTGAMFINRNTENTVVIEIDIDMNDNALVIITVEQWTN